MDTGSWIQAQAPPLQDLAPHPDARAEVDPAVVGRAAGERAGVNFVCRAECGVGGVVAQAARRDGLVPLRGGGVWTVGCALEGGGAVGIVGIGARVSMGAGVVGRRASFRRIPFWRVPSRGGPGRGRPGSRHVALGGLPARLCVCCVRVGVGRRGGRRGVARVLAPLPAPRLAPRMWEGGVLRPGQQNVLGREGRVVAVGVRVPGGPGAVVGVVADGVARRRGVEGPPREGCHRGEAGGQHEGGELGQRGHAAGEREGSWHAQGDFCVRLIYCLTM